MSEGSTSPLRVSVCEDVLYGRFQFLLPCRESPSLSASHASNLTRAVLLVPTSRYLDPVSYKLTGKSWQLPEPQDGVRSLSTVDVLPNSLPSQKSLT